MLQIVERRGHARDVVEALLDRDVRDRTFFDDQARAARAWRMQLTTPVRDVTRGARRRAQRLAAADRRPLERLLAHRHDRRRLRHRPASTGRSLPATPRSRDVVRAFRQAPVEVRRRPPTDEGRPSEDTERPTKRLTADEQKRRRIGVDAGGSAAAGARARTGRSQIASLDEFVEHFIALGRKGVAVNRYKGLGEMNPSTLWATTMNPETRTLLQVKAEDHTEADQMFTTLMGDQVEPRRKFIEDNALDVRNLDI